MFSVEGVGSYADFGGLPRRFRASDATSIGASNGEGVGVVLGIALGGLPRFFGIALTYAALRLRALSARLSDLRYSFF